MSDPVRDAAERPVYMYAVRCDPVYTTLPVLSYRNHTHSAQPSPHRTPHEERLLNTQLSSHLGLTSFMNCGKYPRDTHIFNQLLLPCTVRRAVALCRIPRRLHRFL